MDDTKTIRLKKFLVIACAAVVLIAAVCLPAPPGLSAQGKNIIGLTVFFLILLIARPAPLPVVCLTLIAVMPFVFMRETAGAGVKPEIAGALAGFTNSVPYFTIASFALSYAFISVPLSNRILRFLLTRFAKSTETMILSMMICGAAVSSVISNIPATAIFIALSSSILKTVADEEHRKKLGRTLIIGVVYSGMIGGMMTPAGSSLNMLAIGLLREAKGITITFAQWMIVCVPLVIVLIPAAWFIILRLHKPPKLSGEALGSCARSIEVPEKMAFNELIFIIIFGLTIILWILSSWIPFLDVTMTAIVSACICFLPGLNILYGKKFEEFAKWDVFFVQGTSLSLGFAMIATGADKWFAGLFLSALPSMPVFILISACAAFVFFMLLLIPIAPAMISVFSVQFISLAVSQDISPIVLIFVLTLCTANCYLLPLDSVPLLGLETGYFSVPQMMKSSALLQLLIVCLLSLWLPVICRAIGVM